MICQNIRGRNSTAASNIIRARAARIPGARAGGLFTGVDAPQGRNRHHYEYWTDLDLKTKRYAPVPMPRRYFVEMVMDRIAACKTYHGKSYRDGDALEYLQRSTEAREGSMMHPQTRRELDYVLTMLRDKGEAETFAFLKNVVLKGLPFAETETGSEQKI